MMAISRSHAIGHSVARRGNGVLRMTSEAVALAALIVLLFPMAYFLVTSPTFLLVKLDIPEVSRLLRGHFHAYFLMTSIVAGFATVAFAVSGRWLPALGVGAVTGFALWARPWFLRRIDALLRSREAGDADAIRRLRRLHWEGMVSNAVQFVIIVACIPRLFPA